MIILGFPSGIYRRPQHPIAGHDAVVDDSHQRTEGISLSISSAATQPLVVLSIDDAMPEVRIMNSVYRRQHPAFREARFVAHVL